MAGETMIKNKSVPEMPSGSSIPLPNPPLPFWKSSENDLEASIPLPRLSLEGIHETSRISRLEKINDWNNDMNNDLQANGQVQDTEINIVTNPMRSGWLNHPRVSSNSSVLSFPLDDITSEDERYSHLDLVDIDILPPPPDDFLVDFVRRHSSVRLDSALSRREFFQRLYDDQDGSHVSVHGHNNYQDLIPTRDIAASICHRTVSDPSQQNGIHLDNCLSSEFDDVGLIGVVRTNGKFSAFSPNDQLNHIARIGKESAGSNDIVRQEIKDEYLLVANETNLFNTEIDAASNQAKGQSCDTVNNVLLGNETTLVSQLQHISGTAVEEQDEMILSTEPSASFNLDYLVDPHTSNDQSADFIVSTDIASLYNDPFFVPKSASPITNGVEQVVAFVNEDPVYVNVNDPRLRGIVSDWSQYPHSHPLSIETNNITILSPNHSVICNGVTSTAVDEQSPKLKISSPLMIPQQSPAEVLNVSSSTLVPRREEVEQPISIVSNTSKSLAKESDRSSAIRLATRLYNLDGFEKKDVSKQICKE